jgi:exodeoxyribonuclease-5
LKDVMRQQAGSGILKNATTLRNELLKGTEHVAFSVRGEPDIFKMGGDKLEDGLRYAYDKYGEDNTMVICRSNKSAVMYNQHIRNALLFRTEEIEAGDLLMIVRNNYFYVPEETPSGFLANGDFITITKIVSLEELYGFRFATIEFKLVDYPEMEPFSAKVILDTLHSETPAMSQEDNRAFYHLVLEDYKDVKNKKELNEKLREDPYLNALQIKFAYAVTCHKSQGGQWPAVFVDQGYITEDRINTEFIRWLYTAITRATDQAFLVNFDPKFFV